jgi:phospholipase/carboxylesterase
MTVRLDLPKRQGPRPRTTPTNPHTQLDQNPPRAMYDALAKRLFALPSVIEEPSGISVPGARALIVDPSKKVGPRDSFMIGREFAHVHPPSDASLHLSLPPEMVEEVMDNGWAELHPVALRGLIPMNIVMVYAPRDDQELDVVMKLVEASRARAIP